MLFHRQESHSDRVLARRRQGESERLALAREKLVWNLNQNPGAIAGFWIAATCSAVRKINEDLNPLLNDLMALLSANASHKTDSASVVLVRRIVKTLRRRQTVLCLPVLQRVLLRTIRSSLVVGHVGFDMKPSFYRG
jgi:hypothetical protein